MSCNPATLLADAAPFNGMDEGSIRIAKLALLKRWLLELDPGADVTVETILAQAGANYGGMSEGQIRIARLQLLCQISQA